MLLDLALLVVAVTAAALVLWRRRRPSRDALPIPGLARLRLDAAAPWWHELKCAPGFPVLIRGVTPALRREAEAAAGDRPVLGDVLLEQINKAHGADCASALAVLEGARRALEQAKKAELPADQVESLEKTTVEAARTLLVLQESGRARRLYALRESSPVDYQALQERLQWMRAFWRELAIRVLVKVPAWDAAAERMGVAPLAGPDPARAAVWIDNMADDELRMAFLAEVAEASLKASTLGEEKKAPSGRPSGSPWGMRRGIRSSATSPKSRGRASGARRRSALCAETAPGR